MRGDLELSKTVLPVQIVPGVNIPVHLQPTDYNQITGEVFDTAGIRCAELEHAIPDAPYSLYRYTVVQVRENVEKYRRKHRLQVTDPLPVSLQIDLDTIKWIGDQRERKTANLRDKCITLGDFKRLTQVICLEQQWRSLRIQRCSPMFILQGIARTQPDAIKDWFEAWGLAVSTCMFKIASRDEQNADYHGAMLSWYAEMSGKAEVKADDVTAVEPEDVEVAKIAQENTIKEGDEITMGDKEAMLSKATTEVLTSLPPRQEPNIEPESETILPLIRDVYPEDDMVGAHTAHEIEPEISMKFHMTFNFSPIWDVVKLSNIEYCDMVTDVTALDDKCSLVMTLTSTPHNMGVAPRDAEGAPDGVHDIVDLLTRKAAKYYMMLHKCAMVLAETREAVERTNIKE